MNKREKRFTEEELSNIGQDRLERLSKLQQLLSHDCDNFSEDAAAEGRKPASHYLDEISKLDIRRQQFKNALRLMKQVARRASPKRTAIAVGVKVRKNVSAQEVLKQTLEVIEDYNQLLGAGDFYMSEFDFEGALAEGFNSVLGDITLDFEQDQNAQEDKQDISVQKEEDSESVMELDETRRNEAGYIDIGAIVDENEDMRKKIDTLTASGSDLIPIIKELNENKDEEQMLRLIKKVKRFDFNKDELMKVTPWIEEFKDKKIHQRYFGKVNVPDDAKMTYLEAVLENGDKKLIVDVINKFDNVSVSGKELMRTMNEICATKDNDIMLSFVKKVKSFDFNAKDLTKVTPWILKFKNKDILKHFVNKIPLTAIEDELAKVVGKAVKVFIADGKHGETSIGKANRVKTLADAQNKGNANPTDLSKWLYKNFDRVRSKMVGGDRVGKVGVRSLDAKLMEQITKSKLLTAVFSVKSEVKLGKDVTDSGRRNYRESIIKGLKSFLERVEKESAAAKVRRGSRISGA